MSDAFLFGLPNGCGVKKNKKPGESKELDNGHGGSFMRIGIWGCRMADIKDQVRSTRQTVNHVWRLSSDTLS